MRRLALAAAGVAVALAVPLVLAVNGIRAVTNGTFVRGVYDHGGVPDDRFGLTDAQRRRLAIVGLRSIQPGEPRGIDLLRAARLPDGEPAFGARELRHMHDVRTLLGTAYAVQIAIVVALAVLAVALGLRRRTRAVVPVALRRGAVLTVALAALVGVLSLTDWGWFSGPFHAALFAGDSWRFADEDTLRRLYPDRFWVDTAIVVGLLALLQAAVVWVVARWWARKASPG